VCYVWHVVDVFTKFLRSGDVREDAVEVWYFSYLDGYAVK
jgi:hypothetical protein